MTVTEHLSLCFYAISPVEEACLFYMLAFVTPGRRPRRGAGAYLCGSRDAAPVQELEREKETVERIWKRAERWGNWGQWAGPESFAFFRPLGSLVKATFRAAKWAAGDPERQNH